jgi:thymidylate synthase (FAD)
MEVEVLQKTESPERLVCQAARGDYSSDYIGDIEFGELMKDSKFDDRDVEGGVYREDGDYKSYDHPSILDAKVKAFIERQLSRGHYGPWEHPSITFAVSGVSRVTMAQITRHRHMSFDVQSMRYVDFREQEVVTPRSLTDDDHFTREGGETEIPERRDARMMYENAAQEMVDAYLELVEENNVPKEDARYILPLGMSVNMTFSGNARSFMHLFNLRQKASSQWEIRELSEMLSTELKEWMPHSFSWYEQNRPHKIGP